MKISKEELENIVRNIVYEELEEANNADMDLSAYLYNKEIPIKRIIKPLPYKISLEMALKVGTTIYGKSYIDRYKDFNCLQKEKNEFIINIYDDLSKSDEIWHIATNLYGYKFEYEINK